MSIPKTLSIPVPKRKGATVTFNLDTSAPDCIPDSIYQYALELGLKAIMARGYTKWDKDAPDADEQARAIEAKNYAAVIAGKVRMVGSSSGPSMTRKTDPVQIEALRLAKLTAKDQAKASGVKISKVPASEWTRVATAMIDAEPDTWTAAALASLSRSGIPLVGHDFIAQLGKIADEAPAKAKAEKKVAKPKTEAKPAPVKAKAKRGGAAASAN